jgi:N-dimethylarginine dimethylaminohydrolase
MREDRPNAIYVRDLMFMTPEGAIVGRPAMASRRGEERFVAEALARLGVPVIKTVNGDGIFEGACAMWVDRETVILGTGSRTNQPGAAQVEAELRNIGVSEVIRFQIPYGHAHIDGLMNIADRKVAMVFPWQTPFDVCRALLDRGFTLVEATSIEEVKVTFGVNFVALEPGKVVMPAGNPRSKATLESAGIKVIEVDVSEIMKGWGAIHCATAFLKRDPL